MPDDERLIRVFLSFSHDSPAHVEQVLAVAERLCRDGIDAWSRKIVGWAVHEEESSDRASEGIGDPRCAGWLRSVWSRGIPSGRFRE